MLGRAIGAGRLSRDPRSGGPARSGTDRGDGAQGDMLEASPAAGKTARVATHSRRDAGAGGSRRRARG